MNAVTLSSIVLILLIAFALYLAVVSAVRLMRDQGPLRLYRLARAKGLQLPGATSEAEIRAAAYAARRCAGCISKERCDEMLDSKNLSGLREICPNTAFLDRLES